MPRLLIASTVTMTLERFLLPVADHMRGRGWVVDGMATGVEHSEACRQAFDHVYEAGWTRDAPNVIRHLIGIRRLRRLVKAGGYDVVHLHTPIAGFAGRLGLRRLRRRLGTHVVYTAHGFHFHPNGRPLANAVFRSAERLAAHWTDELLVINRDDHIAARTFPALADHQVHLTRGVGLDLGEWRPDAVPMADIVAMREGLDLEEGARIFNLTARLERVKRIDIAIRAIGELRRGDVHLVVVGDGPLRYPLERLSAELGLAAQVHFVGRRTEVPVFMRASVATLCTSSREGLPRTVLESMSLGVPVIGVPIRGVRDLVGNDECGLITEGDDPRQVAAAMRRLLDDPQLAGRLGAAGVRRAGDYDLEGVVAFHEQLYEGLAIRRRGVAGATAVE